MSLRQANAELNLREYRARQNVLQSRPRFLIVELTQGCNLRCPMCRDDVAVYKQRKMSTDTFNKIANELFDTADLIDLRGWGESLLLPDIHERVRIASDAGAEIRFVTNLSFRRDGAIEMLAQHHAHLGVSVDTADSTIFAHLRRNGRLELVTKNLEQLCEAYRTRWGSTDRIGLICTVQRPALEQLPDLADLAASVGVRRIALSGVSAPIESPLALEGFDHEVDEALAALERRASGLGVEVTLSTRLGSRPANPATVPSCVHVWSYAHFSYDGRVGYCDHLIGPDLDDHLMGSLHERTFEEIWNGPEWLDLRRRHADPRTLSPETHAACSWCYSNRYIEFEDRFAPELSTLRQTLG